MRRITIFLLAAALLATAGAALTYSSANFDLSWNVIGGGGGHSTSGSYEVRGTIGQSLAGPPRSASAQYAVEGGFWAGVPLETPAPEPETWKIYLPAIANHD